ncbi:hypothetical protein GYMLUDRAFT_48158 [Collybiopsis luxurians FD-317 M1]|uniref:G-protein coupled receptors family 1 profile domain-containing protein n=1 Tax=Collybiopsis luxurians FD-317 M1 TaxID=944289 RepID=A0A0D0AX51_9AGAR|nr:hypothetical protein GYMLUDRAFT_48158 [Collybiopsis luxurians FD-317 M1]
MVHTDNTLSVTPTINFIHGTRVELIVFLALNMWSSHFGLPILLATVLFSKRVQRHPTFINLLIVYIIVGISFSLLAYAGKAVGPEPSFALCLIQASLLYGMPAITSLTAFFLVLQMLLPIRAAFYKQAYREQDHFMRLWVMVVLPYAVCILFIVTTAFVGAANPSKVNRDHRFFYCSVRSDGLIDALILFSAVVSFATLVLEVWTVVLFYKRWTSIQRGSCGVFTLAELDLPLRILSFGIYLVLSVSLGLLSVSSSAESPVPDLMIASAGTLLIFIFGTQPDILRALCFWKKEGDARDTDDVQSCP